MVAELRKQRELRDVACSCVKCFRFLATESGNQSRRLSRLGMCAAGPNLEEIRKVSCATTGREMHRIEWHVNSRR
jgi:hypothetical protein